jgi:hypothetical protein
MVLAALAVADGGEGAAAETAAGFMHWAELIITAALVAATTALFWATFKVHHDEVIKMGDHLSHDNDNMTDVAMAEIDAHHQDARNRMARVRHLNRMRRQRVQAKAVRRG